MLDINKIREEFPILGTKVYGKPLVYLDNAATMQKPRVVVEAEREQYYTNNANVHRGVHYLSQQATEMQENARVKVRNFLNAASEQEIIFTRGTTEGINLVATAFGSLLKEGDEIIVSEMEHHSNIVPWQLLQQRQGVVLKVLPFDDNGELDLQKYAEMFTERTRLVSIVHVSNVLGTVNPVKDIVSVAHGHGVPVLIDAAQSVPHFKVDVRDIDCDFLVFSGHKVYAPTGIGVLYGKRELLDKMPPYQGGGEMISTVSFEHTEYETIPYKFEAGTPNYVGANALGIALDFVENIGLDKIHNYELQLANYATEQLSRIDGLRIFGRAAQKDAVVSFLVDGIHHLDMGTLLDRLGIAVRTGHHCAQPIMTHYNVDGMVRASFAVYNTEQEIDFFVAAVKRVIQMF